MFCSGGPLGRGPRARAPSAPWLIRHCMAPVASSPLATPLLPSQPWPPSSPQDCSSHAALPLSSVPGSLSSAILSTFLAHCSLLLTSLHTPVLCTPVSSLNSLILRLSARVTLAIFRTHFFFTLAAFVIVRPVPRFPFRTGMPVSHKCS